MNLLGPAVSVYLGWIDRWLRRAGADPAASQRHVLRQLVGRAEGTWFGRRHGFASIRDHADFAKAVPIADPAAYRDLVERMWRGEPNVCWPGRVKYFARTSGTSLGQKRIPVTADLRRSNVRGGLAVFALSNRARPGTFTRLMDGQLMLLGATTRLQPNGYGAWVGHLSGISAHWVPRIGWGRYEPGRQVAAIEHWDERLTAIARRTLDRDVRFLTGMPIWTKALFDRLCTLKGIPPDGAISRIWPNLLVYVHWGTSIEPYRATLARYFRPDHPLHYMETYPASEGYVGVQTDPGDPGIEMFVENGLFFEFVPREEWGMRGARRLTVGQVEVGVPYGLVLSSNAGLWAYDIGDVVRFVSLRPPKVLLVGRHDEFMNALGEHVTGQAVSSSVAAAAEAAGAAIAAFTAGPRFLDSRHPLGACQFVVEFAREPAAGRRAFARELDRALVAASTSYADRRRGDTALGPAEVTAVPPGTFQAWFKGRAELDAHHKVPVCASDRRWLDGLLEAAQTQPPQSGPAGNRTSNGGTERRGD
jgi:hypothetical protein